MLVTSIENSKILSEAFAEASENGPIIIKNANFTGDPFAWLNDTFRISSGGIGQNGEQTLLFQQYSRATDPLDTTFNKPILSAEITGTGFTWQPTPNGEYPSEGETIVFKGGNVTGLKIYDYVGSTLSTLGTPRDIYTLSNGDFDATLLDPATDVEVVLDEISTGGSNPDVTIFGTSGDDKLNGTSGDDVIDALAGDDTVRSGNGDDIIYGGEGRDALHGQNGDDTIYGGDGSRDYLYGGEGHDYLYGETGKDTLWGGYGNDHLYGGDGDDLLLPGDGEDFIDGGSGTDTLSIGSLGTGDYLVNLSAGYMVQGQFSKLGDPNFVYNPNTQYTSQIFNIENVQGALSGAPNGIIIGNEDDNELSNADQIYGGDGNDTISSSGNDKSLHGEGGDDIIRGGGENVFMTGDAGDDLLRGNNSSGTYLSGGDGNDDLIGGSGSEVLDGGDGNDFFATGQGDDGVIMGAGNDYFLIQNDGTYASTGNDTIVDFKSGEDYLIVESASLTRETMQSIAVETEAGVFFNFEDGSLLLDNLTLDQIDFDADFIYSAPVQDLA